MTVYHDNNMQERAKLRWRID